MELLLVRHGLPHRVAAVDGTADPELAPDGRRQAEQLAAYLATERVDAVYSSPMRRARETVAPLAKARDLDVGIVDGVAEWDRHGDEYVPLEQLRAEGDPRFHDLTRSAWGDAALVGPFRERVVAAFEALIAAHPGHRVVVGCHAGVINMYLGEVLGLPADRRGFFSPNYTSIHRVAASRRGERTILTINETSHLRGTGLPVGLLQEG